MADSTLNTALQVFAAGFGFAILFQVFAGMLLGVFRSVREAIFG